MSWTAWACTAGSMLALALAAIATLYDMVRRRRWLTRWTANRARVAGRITRSASKDGDPEAVYPELRLSSKAVSGADDAGSGPFPLTRKELVELGDNGRSRA